ncbi:MAG: tetratricopeptide repeat protein [bacterium]
MKCPFLVKRKEIFDRDGKKIGEEIEIKECIKNECMVYDGAAKLCSLLSSNIKNGIIIEDFKNGVKELKNEMFQRNEALGVLISTTIQTLQDAILNRFDIMKKQNEVIALGFDNLSGIQQNLIETIKNLLDKNITQLETLNNTAREQIEGLKLLQETGGNIVGGQNRLTEDLKAFFTQMKGDFDGLNDNINHKTETLKNAMEKIATTYQVGTETLSSGLEKANSSTQEILKKFEIVNDIVNGINGIAEVVKSEIAGTKTEAIAALQSLITKFEELKSAYNDVSKNQQENQITMFKELQGMLSGKLDELKESLNSLMQLQGTNQQDLIRDLQGTIGFKLDEFKVLFNELTKIQQANTEVIGNQLEKISNNVAHKFDDSLNIIRPELANLKNEFVNNLMNLQNSLNSFVAPIDELKNSLNSQLNVVQEGLHKYNELNDTLKRGLHNIGEFLNNTNQHYLNYLNNIQTTVANFEGLFDKTQNNIANMSEMMNNLNRNYLESLGKIAGLAEGMRKGVENVGVGMQESVKGLVSEMKKEIGDLEKQYEKTFGDIARLSEKFGELNNQISRMTHEIQKQFKESLEQQLDISKFSNEVLKNLKEYFVKQEEQYKQEQIAKKKREALDHFDRATLYYYRGNHELALNEIDKALELDRLAEYLNLKGLILTELGRDKAAKSIFEEALKLEPNLAEIYNNFGLLYIRTKKLNEAVEMFQEAIKRNVNYSLAYVHMGKALIELEKFDEAMSAFQHALEIDPTNREAKELIDLYKQGKLGA